MKILTITWDYLPTHGGIQSYINGLSQYLKKIGNKVAIIANWNPIDVSMSQKINNVQISRIRYPQFAVRNLQMLSHFFWRFCQCLFKILQIIKSFCPDIIHCHVAYPPGLCGVIAAKLLRKVSILTCHGFDINYSIKKEYGIRRFLSGRMFSKIALSMADHVLCASNSLAENIEKLGISRRKITVIPNGVEIRSRERQDLRLRKTFKIDSNPIVLFVGRLEPIKGADVFLTAAKYIIDEIPSTYFIVVGSGSHFKKLKELSKKLEIDKNVFFIGAVSSEKLGLFYSAADIFVQPSFSESFGLSICESLMLQTPVVASNIGGVPEIIEHNFNGILVPPGNPKKLKEAIVYLLKNPEDAKMMAVEGRKIVIERYSWEKIVRQIINVYINNFKQKG